MSKFRHFIFIIFISLFCIMSVGCASMGVEIWERDILASEIMRLDKNAVDMEIDDHIYFSKESSSGGRGFGGGGCGCN